MNKTKIMIAIFTIAVLSMASGAITAKAQLSIATTTASLPTRTDTGAIIVEESILSPSYKQVVFMAVKAIPEDATVVLQISSSEGQVHQYQSMRFPNGLTKGQIIPLWNGSFNVFQTTPWLRFSVTIATLTSSHYISMIAAINYFEQYKEPMVVEISETKISGNKYLVTAKGVFDTTEPSTVVINSNIIIPRRDIRYNGPGVLQFTVDEPLDRFPSGKYLLTVCQTSHCDTMVGRHRV